VVANVVGGTGSARVPVSKTALQAAEQVGNKQL
jgi:hypothetical protein